jgi:hypothetical protein
MMSRDDLLRLGGVVVIVMCLFVVVVIGLSACGGEQSQPDNGSASVPGAEGISVTPVTVDVDGISSLSCVVASNSGSGSIALSCDWGG